MTTSEQQAWVTGLIDAHCHPTESPLYLGEIAKMDAGKLVIMSTHFEDIDLVATTAEDYPNKVIPAFGFHPWFSHLIYLDEDHCSDDDHYKRVIKPEPSEKFLRTLPKPRPFSEYLTKMRHYLTKYPNAIVGELGIDRAFRLPNKNPQPGEHNLSEFYTDQDHQLAVFKLQVQVAVEMNRPISVHSVKSHQVVVDTLTKMNPPPPSICLHSYNGSPEFVRQILSKKASKKAPSGRRLNVFISCSVLINVKNEAKAKKLLEAVPADRVLTESDYNTAGNMMDNYLQESFQIIRQHYGWSAEQAQRQLQDNFDRFLER